MPKNYNAKIPKSKPPVTWSKWTAPEQFLKFVRKDLLHLSIHFFHMLSMQ